MANKKMGEEERVNRFLANREDFEFEKHNRGITLIDKITLEGVNTYFDKGLFRRLKCYLYHFRQLGIKETDITKEFEGKTLLVYKMVKKNISNSRKCPWCYMPTEDLRTHIEKAHNKNQYNLQYLEFQKNLYKELLRIIRDTDYYMSFMFLNAGCQMCDNPVMPGRELCCSIPTSFRDRARSLKIMGVTAANLPEKYLIKSNIGHILLAP